MRVASVLPVGGDSDLLWECLDLLRGQERPLDELIVVDDSGDGSLPWCEGVRVLRSGGRGPYAARNIGWREANADIVLFLDVRSRPRSGWAARLSETFLDPSVALASSDVIVRSGPSRGARAGAQHQFFRRSKYLETFFRPYAPTCNLAVRREDLEAAGGFNEVRSGGDADLCWRILSNSDKRLESLPDTLMEWVPRDRVREYLEQNYRYGKSNWALRRGWIGAGAPQARPHPCTRLARQTLYIGSRFAISRRRGREDQAAIWLRRGAVLAFRSGYWVAAHQRRGEVGGHELGPRNLLSASRKVRASVLHQRPQGFVKALRKALGRSRAGELRMWLLRRYYRLRLRRPVDPDLAVFAAYWYRGYSCNPRAIYECATERVPRIRGVWIVKRDEAGDMPDGVEYAIAGTRRYYDVLARAKTFVNNVNFPDEVVKRSGTVHLMTHHGTPLKHMGLDLKGKPIREGKSDFDALLRRVSRWDFSVSSNGYSTRIWERVYPGEYESLEVGYPRNDALMQATEDDMYRLRRHLRIAPRQRSVLYAPTFRDNDPGYVARLDLAEVAGRLGPDWVVLTRHHYFYDEETERPPSQGAGQIIDVANHHSVEELMLAADVLVTDYSSIMFDYAVLDRPIVIHAPDWEAYRETRGTYFDLLSSPPGPVTQSESDLVDALTSGRADDTAARERRTSFRNQFCALEHGDASKRIVTRLWSESKLDET